MLPLTTPDVRYGRSQTLVTWLFCIAHSRPASRHAVDIRHAAPVMVALAPLIGSH